MSFSPDHSPSSPLEVRVAMDTNPGLKRQQNQDAIGHSIPTDPEQLDNLGRIFVLADGVGGLSGGDLASQYAVSTIVATYYAHTEGDPGNCLARAIAEANNVIYDEWHGQDSPQTMATTVVVAVVRGDDLYIGSVGDSPAYLLRGGTVRQLTRDHTLENQKRDEGTPLEDGDPSGRKLVRALGSQASVKVDIISGKVRAGDHVVLCSDGLTRYVTPDEIEQVVTTSALDNTVTELITMANDRGGADNVSVIVLRLHDDDLTAQVGNIADPMAEWGVPRRTTDRHAKPEPELLAASYAGTASEAEPDDMSPARRRQLARASSAAVLRKLAEGPFGDVWQLLRGNVVVTGVGMAIALIIFILIMIAVSNTGDPDSASLLPSSTFTPAVELTRTMTVMQTATAQEFAIQTEAALQDFQAATLAAQAILSLTPPTPVPTHGPQMAEATWFKVVSEEPLPAYQTASVDGEPATPLEPESNYRVTMVNRAPAQGPWYQVIDNLGQESRWVNGPSLHASIVAVDTSGNPLPDDQQPPDIAPPDPNRPTPTPQNTATPYPTSTGTPGTPIVPPATATPTMTPTIGYGADSFPLNSTVLVLADLDLCSTPSVTSCDSGQAFKDEEAQVLAGPVASGEHWWWQVDFGGERIGWVAQVLIAAQ